MQSGFSSITIDQLIGSAGIAQGIFLSAFLLKQGKQKSNRYLGWMVFFLSVLIFQNVFQKYIVYSFPYILLLNFIPFLYGPLLYFYMFHLLYKNYIPKYNFTVHAIPALLGFLFYLLLFLIMDLTDIKSAIQRVYNGDFPLYVLVPEFFKIISGVLYSVLIVRLLKEFKTDLKQWIKQKEQRKWVITVISSFITCWAVVIFNFIYLNIYDIDPAGHIYLISLQLISVVIFIYLIAFFSQKYPFLFSQKQVREKIKKKLNLSDDETIQLENELKELLEVDRIYLEENLSLPVLADEMGVHPNVVSYIINEKFEKNFNEFVNNYRLEHFTELLKMDKDNFLNLAFKSVFYSKSVFNKVFKERYRVSPKEYKKQLELKNIFTIE